MIDIESNINKPTGFGNTLTEADIKAIIDTKIHDFYKYTIVENAISRINELEDRILELEAQLETHSNKSVSDTVLTEKRCKIDIRAHLVFEELKEVGKLDSKGVIYICGFASDNHKDANSVMKRVVSNYHGLAKIKPHKKQGQKKVKNWLVHKDFKGF